MLLSIALLLRESKIVLHNKRGEFSTRLGKPKEYFRGSCTVIEKALSWYRLFSASGTLVHLHAHQLNSSMRAQHATQFDVDKSKAWVHGC